ncbi:hypothetical protein [Paenibacillus sp. FSL K6-0108]|uniref:hypothetical protein n=1 Tax=Paenibacillus sp. FSL K6-0108 TaxID=2921417 RepID=UPI003256963D
MTLLVLCERAGDGGSPVESVFEMALGSMKGHGKVGLIERGLLFISKPSRVEPRE